MARKPKASAEVVFPYSYSLTEAGRVQREYDRKKAGVIVKFSLKLEQAKDLQAILAAAIQSVEMHIASNEKEGASGE